MDIKTTEKTEPTEKNDEAVEAESGTDPHGGDLDGKRAEVLGEGPGEEPEGDLDEDPDEDLDGQEAPAATDAGIGAGAAAVVSAALGAVALTGTWAGKVVSERETLVGQIKTSGSGTPTQQISEIYGDAWHSTALVNGVFALLALIVAVAVLTLPRRPAWVRAVAVAGAVLGGLGLLLSVGTYFDLFLSLPSAGS
ncbi:MULTISPECIES: hypothetical protein [unclassified Streptomyces]|uniref:hypothetical protein n=1 Tax=unclassified Streptomyces TaxID=2593676 RepID=UPI0006AF6407|nr:membrane protein [Streptomyces sp. NRRL F-6491]KOX39194.1 membrane protein [Streptomyces sp. NRRL F-6492]